MKKSSMKDSMIESLTSLLEEGETLRYPIWGELRNERSLQQGYFGFFGFTENYLLIYLTWCGSFSYPNRVPLDDIRSVRIKEHWTQKKCSIDISFHNGAPIRISAVFNLRNIDTQEDNLTMFMDVLENSAADKAPLSLKEVEGKRIRWQYFSPFIHHINLFFPSMLVMLIGSSLKLGTSSWTELLEAFLLWPMGLSPLIVLALLNRFLFGKTIGVMNREGIHVENDVYAWDRIKRIEYHPTMIGKRESFSYASLIMEDSEGREYQVDLLHFPLYGLRLAKEYAPRVKIAFSKEVVRDIVILLVLFTLIPVAILLLDKT